MPSNEERAKVLAHMIVECAIACEPSVDKDGVLIKTWRFDEALVEKLALPELRAAARAAAEAMRLKCAEKCDKIGEFWVRFAGRKTAHGPRVLATMECGGAIRLIPLPGDETESEEADGGE